MNSRSSLRPVTGLDVHGHGGAPYMPETSIDVFAKARDNERVALLHAAREADIVPYFRTVEGPAPARRGDGGRPRIMLGSNNYLGLTGDERVMQGARDALERYGTGLTGSRLLNGTTALHLELEEEIAEWMGTDSAIVFTTGHQANWGRSGRSSARRHGRRRLGRPRLDPRRLPARRAKLRAFRHNRMDKLERMLERAAATAAACSSSSTACSRWRATSRRCARSASSAGASARG